MSELRNEKISAMIESEELNARGRNDQPLVFYEEQEVDGLSDIEQDIWFLIRDIRDPEFPYTLSQLRVLTPAGVLVSSEKRYIRVYFTPTVSHCSLSTLIGLSILYTIQNEFLVEPGWKLIVAIAPGSHQQENEINRQLNDKERVAAALENPRLIKLIDTATRHSL